MNKPYKCEQCGAENCKLWRPYMSTPAELYCVRCAAAEQKENVDDMDADGRRVLDAIPGYRTDQIGWLVPAVPTIEGDTYWGYTAVPEDRVAWWRALPTFPPLEKQRAKLPFSVRNRIRSEHPKGFNHSLHSWSVSDWFLAVNGELGEAANVAKKLNRHRDHIRGNKHGETVPALRDKLAEELGDAICYLDLLVQACGFDFETIRNAAFERKSKEIGYQE